jgi:branched-chain amino acid transport system substrate-binding protein
MVGTLAELPEEEEAMDGIHKYMSAVGPWVVLVSCLSSMPAAADDCEVKIGVTGPMTGGGAAWGLAVKAGTDFEAAFTNEAGGLPMGGRKCKVTVVSVDGQATAAGGAAAANYFASENVHVVNGPVVSPETTGFKPVGKRNGELNFSTAFAADVIGPDWPLAFHQNQSPPTWGPIVIKAAHDRFKFTSAVVMGPNDQGGTDSGKVLTKLYASIGAKTAEEYYQRGTTNFSPLVVRIMSMAADVVETGPMPPGEAAILIKQLLEAGYDGAFGRLGAGAPTLIAGAGGAESLAKFFWIAHVPMDDPGIRKLDADYMRIMKSAPPEGDLFYTSEATAEQFLHAISLAGTDQDAEKIAATLRGMQLDSRYLGKFGWRGRTQYGINQEFSLPIGMGVIENGKQLPMVRLEISTE